MRKHDELVNNFMVLDWESIQDEICSKCSWEDHCSCEGLDCFGKACPFSSEFKDLAERLDKIDSDLDDLRLSAEIYAEAD